MRRRLLSGALSFALLLLFLWAIPASAQEHYTEGPVSRVTLIRVKPNQMDAYLTSLRQSTKGIYDEEKRNGTILDYKVFLKETHNSPQDWDICIAEQYKNQAGNSEKPNAFRLRDGFRREILVSASLIVC